MLVIRSWILCLLFGFMEIFVDGSPVAKKPEPLRAIPFIVQRSDGSPVCEETEAFKWTYAFHDCFINRKYKDGGRDLNSIVDRILDHGEACIETSSKECRPDYGGFIALLNKTIFQMKDYAEMYLEEIYRGREKIKDLECIETVLNIKTYENCFHDIVPHGYNSSEEAFQIIAQEGIFCTNRLNKRCSKEAKTSLNRIVRIVLGVEQPNEEKFEVEVTTTEAPTTTTTVKQVYEDEFEFEGETNKPPNRFHHSYGEETEVIPPTKAPKPWMWYDYLAYPFVETWKWIKGLFG